MLSRFFVIIFAFVITLFAQEEASVFKKANPLQSVSQNQAAAKNPQSPQPAQKNYTINQDTIKSIAQSDEPDVNAGELYENSKPIETKLEAKLQTEQAFLFEPFLIELKISSDAIKSLHPSVMVDASGIKFLNPKAKFNELNKKEMIAKLWFVATNEKANIKEIAVVLKRGDELVSRDGIKPRLPNIKELSPNEGFSNVVAKELSVKSFKASKFDEFSNLVNIELEVKNGNLSEFKIPFADTRAGIENIKGGVDKMSASYFMITPNNIKNISFCYYNTATGDYEFIDVPIKPTSSELSTQTNLNPSESEFATYKSLTIYILIIFCLFGFMLWRSFYALVFAIILGAYALYDARPFSQITIKQGAQVTILPTSGSSVFYVASTDEDVKVLGTSGQYTKILLDGKKIGWIRNENIK